jgi:uncharacterized protein YceH (UPF0502 family)
MTADEQPTGLELSAHELRVLGCLIEKESTTPDAYPLTLNSLRNACNQTTSRDPVVTFSELEIEQALNSLRSRGLTRTVHSTSNRATKYRHVLPEALSLEPAETALLSVLMLRGAQTVGELKGRSERQHRFDSVDEVAGTLSALAGRDQPLVCRLTRQPGQKDARWAHLLGDAVDASSADPRRSDDGRAAPAAAIDGADPYGQATAEFYDLLATDMWNAFGLQLLALLADVDAGHGPIVDIGSGTGIGLQYLLAAVPEARVWAIEPSKAMRVGLHARLTDSDQLSRATTVVPNKLADAELPSQASAIVVSAALGHLSDAERERLWRYVAESMQPGAPAVIGVLPPDHPVEVPLVRYRQRPIGDHVYEGWQSGTPLDDRTMAWTLIYRVVNGATGQLVAEYSATAPWRCDSVAGLQAEVGRFGLVLREHDDCVVISRPTGD